jgi:predicted hydrocarbon binding protein
MRFWFSGLISGLEKVDEPAREAILQECGKACARSYTAAVFQEARKDSDDMETFLAALGAKFRGAAYELINAETIGVRYSKCACDLVETGLIASPVICGCSAHNLRENFERALEKPVTVTLESSILQGASRCEFLVSLAG